MGPNQHAHGSPGKAALERQQAEAVLRQSEARHRLLAEHVRVVLWEADPAPASFDPDLFQFTYVSDFAETMLGFTPQECCAPGFWPSHIHPEDRDRAIRYCLDLTAAKKDHRFEYRMIAADGSIVWVEDVVKVVVKGGKVVALRGVLIDINERKQAEEKLSESEARFRGAFDFAAIGMALVAPNGRWLRVNRSLCDIVGYTEAELLARDFQSITHPHDLNADLEFVRRMLAGSIGYYHMEKRYFHKTGRIVWILLSVSMVRDAQGAPLYFISQIQDITQRKEAEAKLSESEERFRNAFEFAAIGMALVAPNGRWLRVNRALCDIIGYSEKELLARDCHSVTHPDDQEADDRFMGALLDGTIPCFQAEKRYLHKTGHVVWILLSGSLVRDAEGKPLYFIGQMQDITQRKQIEDQLRESEERFRNAFEFAAIGMALAAPDGRWLRVNRALCDLVGYSEAELLALDFQSITHPGDLAADLVYMRGLLEGSISHCQYEKRYLHKSGRVVWILLSGSLVRDGAGAPLYFIGQMQDITQRKEAVETLQEYNQRLKALSHQILQTQETERRRLARELHDEIGQMLTTVGMRLHQLKSKWAVDLRAKGGEKSQILSALDEDIEFVNRTIEQVREMSLNLRPPMLDILGLEATLRWHAENQSQRTGLDIRIEGHLDEKRLPADLEIACFRIVQETLTNVVRHARAKHVCIELRREEHELLLIVSDDGVGFDVQAVQSRAGRGGSFGVLAMRERAELLGGRIDIESAPGRGTRVCARFPMG